MNGTGMWGTEDAQEVIPLSRWTKLACMGNTDGTALRFKHGTVLSLDPRLIGTLVNAFSMCVCVQ